MHESLEWVFNEFRKRKKKDVQNLNKTLSDICVDVEKETSQYSLTKTWPINDDLTQD